MTSLPHEAVFRITTDHAPSIHRALLPEISDEVNPRSITTCTLESDCVIILHIAAHDLQALRAALNMVLRLVNIADEVQDLV